MGRGAGAWVGVVAACACACASAVPTPEAMERDRRDACEAAFPDGVRDRVGLTSERLARFGIVPELGGRAVSRQIEDRTAALTACAPRARGLFATFLVDPAGNVLEPVAAALPADAEAEACATREIARWRVPRSGPGLYVAALRLTPGASSLSGWKPALPTSCAVDARYPIGAAPREVVLHFVVHFDGTKSDLHADRPVPKDLFDMLERGVASCEFEPAWDDANVPRDTWVSLPVRVLY